MYAIIETGGKQYRVSEGDVLKVEKLNVEAGEKLKLEKVMLIASEGNVKVGEPILQGASVSIEVIEHGRGKKIRVFKYKRRKKYRKTQGHRQSYTKIKIEKIEG